MRLQCPACGKENTIIDNCIRCDCKIDILFLISNLAENEILFAKKKIKEKDFESALKHAIKSWQLKKSYESAKIAFIASIGIKNFKDAVKWYNLGV